MSSIVKNPGEYNKKSEIISIKDSEGNAGFKIPEEVIVLAPFAMVKTTNGYKLISNNTDFEKAYTNFTIRYPKVEITRDMNIIYNNKKYSIEYLNNVDEENIELEIQAKVVNK